MKRIVLALLIMLGFGFSQTKTVWEFENEEAGSYYDDGEPYYYGPYYGYEYGPGVVGGTVEAAGDAVSNVGAAIGNFI